MADDNTLVLADRLATLQTGLDELRRDIAEHREADAERLELVEAEIARTRELLARAIAERNRALAMLAQQIRGGGGREPQGKEIVDFLPGGEGGNGNGTERRPGRGNRPQGRAEGQERRNPEPAPVNPERAARGEPQQPARRTFSRGI